MATTPTPRAESKRNRPNPQALNALLDRYFAFMAKYEQEKRAKKSKGRGRKSVIKA